jgi:hypothetical protein
MLTVWRKVHIEVDSMGNAGTGNKSTGTINGTVTIPKRTGQNPAGPVTVVNVNAGAMPLRRFELGRMISGSDSFLVGSNSATSLDVYNTTTRNITLSNGASFTVYDDDDYNANDSTIAAGNLNGPTYLVDGDQSEPIVQLPGLLANLSNADGNNADLSPRNVYASAYVMPEYGWAQTAGYNQTNLTFDANVSSDQTNTDELYAALTANRGSANVEHAEFWVAYFLIGYQGNEDEDGDGCSINPATNDCATDTSMNILPEGAVPGIAKRTLASVSPCDCLSSTTCPAAMPQRNAPIACTAVPTGSFGALIFQEVQQDVFRSWLLLQSVSVNQIPTTAPHELGHQFGLAGDQKQVTFGLMDYSALPSANAMALHPEHIKLIRSRVNALGSSSRSDYEESFIDRRFIVCLCRHACAS